MMAKITIGSLLTYPVFRLGDSPRVRAIRRLHDGIIRFSQILSLALPGFTLLYLLAGFYLPASVNFSPSDSACVFAPALAPEFLTYKPRESFTLSAPPKLSLFGHTILSTHLCVVPTSIPTTGNSTLNVQQFGLPFSKQLTISNQVALSASPKIKGDYISTRSNLIFELSARDVFFDYLLFADGKSVACHVQDNTVVCPINSLNLTQGSPYTFQLKQTLGGSSQSVFNEELTTITSVDIIQASVTEGGTVYEKLSEILLSTSKPIDRIGNAQLSDATATVPVKTVITEAGLAVRWSDELQRQTTYTLTIDSLQATDGGHLEMPYSLTFKTSGGPKVTNSTLPSVRTAQNPDFTLAFDSPLKPDQDLASIVKVMSGGKVLTANYTLNSDQLRIRIPSSIGACTEFTVMINESLTSAYDIAGGNAYTSTHRTQCAREFSIGTSVEGRSIIGYAIGNGPTKVLFLGAIHGNEKSTYYLLSSWLDYLEANPNSIPADKTIIILPKLNPDGFARNSRFNAHNVDLNRNFASASWKPDVVVPGGATQIGAGGSAPLSEPESKSIVDYIYASNPSLILSYHSQGSITIPNASGNSNTLALNYAKSVGYQYVSAEASLTEFEHETTGALEDWLHEVPDIPVVLNELSSHTTTSIFPYHREPMLAVIR